MCDKILDRDQLKELYMDYVFKFEFGTGKGNKQL